MDRRNFLLNSAILASSLWAGCGSSGNDSRFATASSGGGGVDTPTGGFQGRVNRSEVGGADLTVLSIHADPAGVSGAGGDFTTRVSQDGAQLLIVKGSDNSVRALGLSVPGQDSLDLGALSTSLMSVFMVRGILTVVPQEAANRLSEIRALPGFAALEAFVRQQLPTSSVGQLFSDRTFQSLLQTVVEEWLGRNQVLPRSIEPVEPERATGNVGLDYPDLEPTAQSELRFTNRAWRYVSLYHQDLDESGAEIPPAFPPTLRGVALPEASPDNILPSANGVSWGSLFTSQALSPTQGTEVLRLEGRPGVKTLRYYLYGPGTPVNNVAFPASIQAQSQATDAFALTFLYFGLLPILDLVGGFTGGLSRADQLVADLYLGVAGSTVNADGIAQAYESGDQGNIRGAVADFCVAVLGLVAAGTAVLGSGTVAAAAGLVATLTGASALFFSAVNFTAAVLSTLSQPLRAAVEIEAPASAQTAPLLEAGRWNLGEGEFLNQLMPDGSVLVASFAQAGQTFTETVRRVRLSGDRSVLYSRTTEAGQFSQASQDLQLVVAGVGSGRPCYFSVSEPGEATDIVVPNVVTGGPVTNLNPPRLAGIIETGEGRWLALSSLWDAGGGGVQVGFWLENTLDGAITVLPIAALGYATSGQVGFEFKVGADGWTRAIHTGGNTVSHFVFRIDPSANVPIGGQKNIWSASGWSATPEGVFPAGQVMLSSLNPQDFSVNRYGSYVSVRTRSLGANYFPLGPLHPVAGSANDLRLNLSGEANSPLNPASETTLLSYAEYRGDSGSLVDQALLNDSGGMIVHGSNGITGQNYYRFRQPDGTETDVTALLGGNGPSAAAGRYFLVSGDENVRVYRQGDQP